MTGALDLRVDAIARDFERRFATVLMWNEPPVNPSIDPTAARWAAPGKPFRSFRNGIETAEGKAFPAGATADSAEDAAAAFARNMAGFPVEATDTLVWRRRPELEHHRDFEARHPRYTVYCRFAVLPATP